MFVFGTAVTGTGQLPYGEYRYWFGGNELMAAPEKCYSQICFGGSV